MTTLVGLGAFMVNVALVPWRTFVLMKLWAWFVAPLGLPAIGLAHALGIILVVGFLRPDRIEKTPDKTPQEVVFKTFERAAVTALALAVGWMIAGMMP